jgi:threonine dehydratase
VDWSHDAVGNGGIKPPRHVSLKCTEIFSDAVIVSTRDDTNRTNDAIVSAAETRCFATTVCMHKSQHGVRLNGYIKVLFGQLAALDHNGEVMSVTISDIEQAYSALAKQVVRTPMLNSPRLDALAGRRIVVKAECLQRTGSFKYRGASHALNTLNRAEKANGVIAYSSGNHAQGVALAAQERNIPATIVMPDDAPTNKIANTRAYGARVVTYQRGVESREAIGDSIAKRDGLALIKPYDDHRVIAGQASVGVEISQQCSELGLDDFSVLCCCGGGGLSAGIALVLEAYNTGAQLHTCEPDAFDDTARSLITGTRQTNATETGSICDAILTPSPGEFTFPILQRLAGTGLVASDTEVLKAIAVAFDTLKLVVEPGGAIALAAALFSDQLPDSDTLVVVLSGGNVDPRIFQQALGLNR